MTKRKSGEQSVVEIDALDVAEWERDQHTPSASTEAMAALVKQTKTSPTVEPPKAAQPARKTAAIQRTPTQGIKPAVAKPAEAQAKAEAPKPQVKAEAAKPQPQPQPKPEAAKPQPKPEAAKPQPKPEAAKPQPKPEAAKPLPQLKPEAPKLPPKAEAPPPKAEPPKPQPQLRAELPKPKAEPPRPPPQAEIAKPAPTPSPIAKPPPPPTAAKPEPPPEVPDIHDAPTPFPIGRAGLVGDAPTPSPFASEEAVVVEAVAAKDAITQPSEPVVRPDTTHSRLAEEGKRLSTESALRASAPPSRKKLAFIAGAAGGAVLVVVIAVAATGGGGGKASSPSKSAHAGKTVGHGETGAAEPSSEDTPSPSMQLEHAQGSATAAGPVAAGSDQPLEGSDQPPAGSDTGSAAPPAEKPRPAPSHAKPVILEYDEPKAEPKPEPAAPTQEDGAIAKARESYAAGNQRLFVGDPSGAIRAYRQSLAFYSGYVAGYRGLGLAYTQQGDKSRALQAFRTYVGLVPNARDVALIKKRIASLQTP